jgi:hypothetical protein
MMDDVVTWRDLLGKITSDPQERQRVAEAVGVKPITIIRWATDKSHPRQDNLPALLDALPQYREQLAELIAQEYPHFALDNAIAEDVPREIPSEFYARVLNARVTSLPIQRSALISSLILQQIVSHFDPYQKGLITTAIQCVAPAPGQRVRSLRTTSGRATPPRDRYLEHRTLFLGAESQSGQTILSGRPIIMQNHEEIARVYPIHFSGEEGCCATFPVMQADYVAGCLCVASLRENFFTQTHINLLQNYANLMTFAFKPGDFYKIRDLELGVMPPRIEQQPIIATFQQRVRQHMIDATQRGETLLRPEAELIVWRELEEELLQLALQQR